MFELLVAIAAIGLAYLLYRSNPEGTEKWTKRGIFGWYTFIGVTYALIVVGLLMTGHPQMVLFAGVILFVMTLLVLVRKPHKTIQV